MTGSISIEPISFRQMTGTPVPRQIVVTGWGVLNANPIEDWSDDGRLWCHISGGVLSCYRRINTDGTFDAAMRVMFGTITANAVTLAQDNTSGLTGSMEFDEYADGDKFDIIVTYCDEIELKKIIGNEDQASALDTIIATNDALGTRWEDQLLRSKEDVDRILTAGFGRQKILYNIEDGRDTHPFKLDQRGRWMLAAIASPAQLIKMQVFKTAMNLCEKRAPFNTTFRAMFEFYEKRFVDTMGDTRIIIDHEADQVVDAEAKSKRPARELERS